MLKVEGIIIEPDPDSRARMKQACFAVPVLSKIESAADFSDVLRRLTKQAETDYTAIFVSYRFSPAQIAEFIKNAKTTELGQDCAFVMVLKNIEQGSQLITDGLQLGADGFLFEPFSVESLKKLAALLLNEDQNSWTTDKISKLMAGNKNIVFKLNNKTRVIIGYRTAWIDDRQILNFRKDLYGRDAKIKKVLFENFNSIN
jgi:hypothetical protein